MAVLKDVRGGYNVIKRTKETSIFGRHAISFCSGAYYAFGGEILRFKIIYSYRGKN
jgi:hypothetical protein